MKRFFSIALSLVLLVSLCVPALGGEGDAAVVLTNQALRVDGAAQTCEVYNIGGSNYFKLRDIALLLSATNSRFDVGYDEKTRTAAVTTGAVYHPDGSELILRGDLSATAQKSSQDLLIDGVLRDDLDAWNIGGNNFFRLRDLGGALNFDVDYDEATRTMLVWSRSGAAVTVEQTQVAGIGGYVTAVDLKNPRVRVETAMVDRTVAARAPFADIVAHSGGALAVITGNFMNGDSEGNYPVGHVMSNGELLYIGSGFTTVGITAGGEVRFGRPSVRVRMDPTDRDYKAYTAIGMNLRENEQASQFSVLYTPAFGAQFEVTDAGSLTTVRGGVVTAYAPASPGDVAAIPADGYVLWLSDTYMRDFVRSFQPPVVGEGMALEYFVYGEDAEGFSLDGVTQLVAGAPRLVKDGAICTEQEPQFSGDRFAEDFASSRTALGVRADGTLVFFTAFSATIPQLREAMLALGCVDAVNLDGGASVALYYDGKILAAPGRELATTIRIFAD